MPLKQRFDRLLLTAAVVETVLGLAVVASASWLIAVERYHRPGTYFLSWQAAAAMVGMAVLVAAMHVRVELFADERLGWVMLAVSAVLLVGALAQAPVAHTHRWVGVGGLSVQPSVLARVAVIVLASVQLRRLADEGWQSRRLVLVGGAVAATAGLILLEPDLGSSVLLLAIVAAMAVVAGIPARLMAAPAVAGLVAVVAAVATSPYRLARVRAFFDPQAASAAAWQTRQSLIAIGSGGVLGRGYGAGLQKLFFLPEPHTDFIFAIISEELGLIGALTFLLLVAVIAWRGLRIARRQTQPHLALLAFGLTFAFALQSLLHMSVCLGLAPPKGIPLPLVSYGKTDLVVSLGSLGLLLNLSREVTS
ncbi:MAG: FtsW/RodA/SpoVE family cell cycle protein [Acidobacteria bacterium]|nr:FtsW/RodA/SpoVE family cell cycle protein [Acidobacteriota bacterium]